MYVSLSQQRIPSVNDELLQIYFSGELSVENIQKHGVGGRKKKYLWIFKYLKLSKKITVNLILLRDKERA